MVEETANLDEKKLPFIVYRDTMRRRGADDKINLEQHALIVERFSRSGIGGDELEKLIDERATEYSKEKVWLQDEQCFVTIYEFEILCKI